MSLHHYKHSTLGYIYNEPFKSLYIMPRLRMPIAQSPEHLKDSNSPWRTSDSALHVQWSTGHEEGMPTHRIAPFAQCLKIPHLADRSTYG